jgi:hypothetical protein
VAFVWRIEGLALAAFVTVDTNTFQAWWTSVPLGSWLSFVPYHTAARRPADPATAHGMMFVTDGGLLSWRGVDHVFQPDAAVEYE